MFTRDTIIRMALASMAADRTSSLTTAQRQWIIDLAGRETPLSDRERFKLRVPLLAWLKERQPRIEEIVSAQFEE